MKGRGEGLARRRLPPRRSELFGGDLRRLILTSVARLSLIAGEEFGQRFCGVIGNVRRRIYLGEPQWLGEPTSIREQALRFPGHLGLLEVVDELHCGLALGLTNRFEDAALGDAAEIIV